MIDAMPLSALVAPLQATLHGADVSFARVSTDTRSVAPGDCFVALKGERFDAHDFLAAARDAGAVAAIVETADPTLGLPQLQVADTTKALGQLAQLGRQQYGGPLIGLTGSCGKTTVKEMLVAVTACLGEVHATRGNLNNHIGVPMTLLAMPAGSACAVIEMGASGMGEIDYLAGLAEPTVALVNNVMAAHLEGFGSERGVAQEKSNIYRRLRQGGTAVLNLDDRYCAEWQAELAQTRADIHQVTFSVTRDDASVYASNVALTATGRYRFDICTAEDRVSVELPLLGKQNIANALAATACALAVGVSLMQAAAGLTRLQPVAGRLVPMAGLQNALVIDDTYNANPGSVRAAAAVLADLQSAGRDVWLALGDLGELGDGQQPLLQALGEDLARQGIAHLLTCGNNSRWISEGFDSVCGQGQSSQHFTDQQSLVAFLTQQLAENTVVLVKGSRSARMESVVQAITSGGEQ